MTAPSGILTVTDLQKITGLEKPGDISRCLREQGIKIFHGRKGVIFTTISLLNAAGGINGHPEDNHYPEDLIG